MGANITWMMGELRMGPEYEKDPDDYTTSCNVWRHGPDVVYVGKLTGPVNRALHRNAMAALRREGFRIRKYTRVIDGRVVQFEKEIAMPEDYVTFTMERGRSGHNPFMQKLSCTQYGTDAECDRLQEQAVKMAMEAGFKDLEAKRARKAE